MKIRCPLCASSVDVTGGMCTDCGSPLPMDWPDRIGDDLEVAE